MWFMTNNIIVAIIIITLVNTVLITNSEILTQHPILSLLNRRLNLWQAETTHLVNNYCQMPVALYR